MFETLDQEKTVLVEKICRLNKTIARRDDRIEFFEGHTTQLTEDLKKKSRLALYSNSVYMYMYMYNCCIHVHVCVLLCHLPP